MRLSLTDKHILYNLEIHHSRLQLTGADPGLALASRGQVLHKLRAAVPEHTQPATIWEVAVPRTKSGGRFGLHQLQERRALCLQLGYHNNTIVQSNSKEQ